MTNRIIFLGTAGDSIVAAKQLRESGGIILQTGETQFHLDPGPGAVVRAAQHGINLRANTALLVTNSHILNCNDVNAVIDAMTYGGMDKGGVLAANETVINGIEGHTPCLSRSHRDFLEKIIVVNAGKRMGIEDVEIDAIKATTKDPHAVGFKFYTNDFVLGYAGDTEYSKELKDSYSGCDILIVNVQMPGNERAEHALNSDEAIKLINGVEPKLAIITHFGMSMIKMDPIYEGRRIQKETGVQVLAAKDGMVLSPASYSAKSKQKRLGSFEEVKEAERAEKSELNSDDLNEEILGEKELDDAEETNEESREDTQEHLKF